MAHQVTDILQLKKYIEGVMERSADHAGDVHDVVLPLAGAIVWKKDEDQEIEILVNVLWVFIGGMRYAFSYNHIDRCIEMRAKSTQGKVIASFTNMTTNGEIKNFFASL